MKTTPAAQLANVVNASVTMFFHSVQRLRRAPVGAAGPVGRTDQRAMLESPISASNPPLDLVHLARQCLGDRELETELLGLFRLQAPALTAQLSGSPPLSLECKSENRSHAAGLGARGRRRARRPRGVAHRGIGLGRGRPKLGGSATRSRALLSRWTRPWRKSTAFGARGRPPPGTSARFRSQPAKSRRRRGDALRMLFQRRRACSM